jgi:hypothetical protein
LSRPKQSPQSLRRALLAVSAVAAVIASTAWVMSFGPPSSDPCSFRLLAHRYTLRNQNGWLRLLGPPPPPASASSDASHWVEKFSSDPANIAWIGFARRARGEEKDHFAATPEFFTHSDATLQTKIPPFPLGEVTPPLLDALENPDRLPAAHICLLFLHNRRPISRSTRREGDQLIAEYGGLHARLRPSFLPKLDEELKKSRYNEVVEICKGPQSVSFDVSQFPRIRRVWHDRFDVRVVSVPHAAVVAVALVIPITAVCRWWRSRREMAAHEQGVCPKCGYDLRAGHEHCPECGNASREVPESRDSRLPDHRN